MEKALGYFKERLDSKGAFIYEPRLINDLIFQKRREGISVIATSGTFNFFHPGHCLLFIQAIELYPESVIWVSIDSDSLSTQLKGENKFRQPELWRAAMVYEFCSQLGFSDVFVTIHRSVEELFETVRLTNPDIFFYSLARGYETAKRHAETLVPFMSTGKVHIFESFAPVSSSLIGTDH